MESTIILSRTAQPCLCQALYIVPGPEHTLEIGLRIICMMLGDSSDQAAVRGDERGLRCVCVRTREVERLARGQALSAPNGLPCDLKQVEDL
jgi:hypothetical protein